MSDLGLLVYGCVGFLVSIVSAIASGGGGFVMTPLAILLGLSPGEAIASGKFGGLSTTTGSLIGMRSRSVQNKRTIVVVVCLAIVAGILSSQLIRRINSDAYTLFIALLLIVIAPIIWRKKVGQQKKTVTRKTRALGYVAVFLTLLAQGTFSSGLGVLVTLAMISGLGMEALDANITKRSTQLVLNSIVILGVLGSGLIIWEVALVGSVGNVTGSMIGGKIAVKKGSQLVSKMLSILALASGVSLLLL